ncbi:MULTISPECIES: methyl-accepting chemotaxis protein [Gulbenkiania]|uniref:Methyl-accepting chemotaxis sensory transducer with Cache sensor n=2 Tax=Gulbenkiania TaxID=397456 RepID=A0A0K6GT38_9NEIS|nr:MULTISPECIES: methyl-accepting chemotaxis protein [Gulbenkiania]TCW31672.1 methyl-accepting chemotaxis protein [Gulbenkiania mobilis]CUA81797.1 methyl-accepting chemotaxis sensory transducer with Cache sensor [Gulbenkiania indica]
MKSLRSRLIAFNVLMMALFGLVLVVLTFTQMRQQILLDLKYEFGSALEGQAAVVRTWMDEKKQQISAQAETALQPDAIRFLKQGARAGRFFVNYIGYADNRSLFSDDWQAPADYRITERDWYKAAIGAGKAIVTEPYVDEASKRLTVTVAVPFTAAGATAGVAAGDVFVDELVRNVLSLKVRGSGYAFLVNRSGRLIAHPDAKLTLKPVSSVAPALTAERIAALAQDNTLADMEFNGTPMLLSLKPIAGSDWYVGLVADKDEIMAPLRTLLYTLVGLSLLVFALMVPFAGAIIGRMLKGLVVLKSAMEDIARGAGDLTRQLEARGQDEIADTARAFNQFVAQLNTLFRGLRDEAGGVIRGVQSASSLVGQVADSSRQMADVSSSNAATLEEITVSISHIADNSREADQLVQDTGRELESSASNMQRLAEGMESTVGAVRGLESMLGVLDKRSQEISGITNVIRDIADQTNLLALNAAIEAARAGEQGRGFAVVADEVRKLAERTAQATLEISGMVNAIRDETSRAVGDVNQTVGAVDQGVELTRSAVENIGRIRASMQAVVDKMHEIAHSTTEQHNATTLIAQSTEAINNRVIENDEALHTVSSTLQQLSGSAGNMDTAFSRFKL